MDDGSPPPDLGFAPGNKKRASESNGVPDPDDVQEADSSHSASRRRRDLVRFSTESPHEMCSFVAMVAFGYK